MSKHYLKSRSYTMFFVIIDIVVTVGIVALAWYSINQNGQYRFDFQWMIIFFIAIFFIIFNAHFVYIGAFSVIEMDKDSLKIRKAISVNTQIKWQNIVDIRIANELRHYIKTVDTKVIVIDAYDEISKSEVSIQIDYRKKVYNAIVEGANNADAKTIKKMEKYFD